MLRAGALALLVVLTGCSEGGGTSASPDLAPALDPLISARPYGVTLPAGHDSSQRWPLLVILHGYTASGAAEDAYLGITAQADAHGAIVATPDGTTDARGNPFWNATDACCNFGHVDVDDVAYLSAVIKDATLRYHADPKRVFLIGHSNGAFMAHRMACERADLVAGIAALAGVVWQDASRCTPSQPLAVAQIHGDADMVIPYQGGTVPGIGIPFPSAPTTFMFWAGREGCSGQSDGAALDLELSLAGAETQVTRATGCTAGGAAELWDMHGGSHVPNFGTGFASAVYEFFAAHPRP